MPFDGFNGLGETLGGRAHQFAVRWHADRQWQGALGATGLAQLHGTLDGLGGTGDHHLTRRVEIHRADDFTLCRFGAGCNNVSIIQTQNGGHAALTRRHRFLHQLAATLDKLYGVGQAQALRGYQCAVFTQTVTGDECRNRTALGQPHVPQGNGSGQNGRLGLVGLVEQLGRTVLSQCPQVVAEGFGSLLESVEDQRMVRALLGEHTERLRSLTRKDECEGCRHLTSL